MAEFLGKISTFIWGSGLVFLLLLTGIIYTLKLGFIQFKLIPRLIHCTHKSRGNINGSSQFRTVCMSLGTAMGTGNITGVAAAVSIGGAGSIFWMWVSAFLGMALVYAENCLSVTYSSAEKRGPMAYIEKGIGSRCLAFFFAIMCIGACFGMGGMVQVNSYAQHLENCISVNKYLIAAASFILIFLVTSGGAKRIGTTAQMLLPAASLLYMAVSVAVLFRFRERLPQVFSDIFSEALGLRQTLGGAAGFTVSKAVSVGIRRGIFSNEAGLGSSPILHSSAENSSPQLQGLWSMFEVFFDTVICCTLTALVILCAAPDLSIETAFASVLGNNSTVFLALEMIVFAFCTIIGWFYCGSAAYRYISGKNNSRGLCLAFAAAASIGAVAELRTVWTLSDIFNGLMALPNLLGLLLLVKKVKSE